MIASIIDDSRCEMSDVAFRTAHQLVGFLVCVGIRSSHVAVVSCIFCIYSLASCPNMLFCLLCSSSLPFVGLCVCCPRSYFLRACTVERNLSIFFHSSIVIVSRVSVDNQSCECTYFFGSSTCWYEGVTFSLATFHLLNVIVYYTPVVVL